MADELKLETGFRAGSRFVMIYKNLRPAVTCAADGTTIYHEDGFPDCRVEDLPRERLIGCIYDLIAVIRQAYPAERPDCSHRP